jgi:hypothetical protein
MAEIPHLQAGLPVSVHTNSHITHPEVEIERRTIIVNEPWDGLVINIDGTARGGMNG